jgi:hypothetical protein
MLPKQCPYCGSEIAYVIEVVRFNTEYKFYLDKRGTEAEDGLNTEEYEGLNSKLLKKVYCLKCGKYLGKRDF